MPDEVNFADLIRPMPGKIAVLVETKSQRTPSGLYIPEDTARSIHEEKATQGTVVAVGSSVDDEDSDLDAPTPVSLGDVVLFGKYTGTVLKYQPDDRTKDPQKIVIMSASAILAVLMSPDQAKSFNVRG